MARRATPVRNSGIGVHAMEKLKKSIDTLYTGASKKAAMFRYLLIGFDVATIVFFIATVTRDPTPAILAGDFVIGALILADFLSRLWIATNRARRLIPFSPVAPHVDAAQNLALVALEADRISL